MLLLLALKMSFSAFFQISNAHNSKTINFREKSQEFCVSIWDRFEMTLRRRFLTYFRWFWDRFETILRWIWDVFQMDLRWFWDVFEMSLRWIWDGFPRKNRLTWQYIGNALAMWLAINGSNIGKKISKVFARH